MLDDNSVEEFYQIELRNVPGLFRMSKRKLTVLSIITAVLVIIDSVLLTLFPNSIIRHQLYYMDGRKLPVLVPEFNIFNTVMIILVSCLLVCFLLWIIISINYDKKAYAKANIMAAEMKRWNKEQQIKGNRSFWD